MVGTLRALLTQLLVHGGIALALVVILLRIDAAQPLGVARYVAAAWAFLTGLALSHIIHEWCHFFGARAASSLLTVKPIPHPLFFDYDLEANSSRQFLWLSVGGLLGNVLLLTCVLLLDDSRSLITASLLAAVAGQLVFVLVLEAPVSLAVIGGGEPLESLASHFGQGGPLFLRAGIAGLATAAAVLLLYG